MAELMPFHLALLVKMGLTRRRMGCSLEVAYVSVLTLASGGTSPALGVGPFPWAGVSFWGPLSSYAAMTSLRSFPALYT